ncbi:MAG: hypothetical protein ACFFDS_02665 [Candidatus Thorarchaeota archaeon]
MLELGQYENAIWALVGAVIGAILGFSLSFLTIKIQDKKNYKKLFNSNLSKIISYIRDGNIKISKQALSEIEAMFKESDQLKILDRASLESSLNASNNEITDYILDKLEWMLAHYNIYIQGRWEFDELGLERKKDIKKINSIHSMVWTLLHNVVEIHQSISILRKSFPLIEDLDRYSLEIEHYELLVASIRLYIDIGTKSIGIDYLDGFNILNFGEGISLSIEYLQKLHELIQSYCKDEIKKKELISLIDSGIEKIRKEKRDKLG